MATKRSRQNPKPVESASEAGDTRNGSRFPRPLQIALVLILLVGLTAAGLRLLPGPRTQTPSGADLGRLPKGVASDRLSLLLVTLDTTRADRIGAYGYTEIETPSLDRLAREGVLFEQAESVAPLTLPAHSSMFTGQFPPAHGVRDNGGFYLDEEHRVLAEVLKEHEFRTGGFVGSFVLDSKWGIAQGFDTYFDDFDLRQAAARSLGEIERPASEVVDTALAWLEEAPKSQFFSWVHLYDPHSPYKPPEPWASRYSHRPYVGEIAYVDSQIGRLLSWLDANDRGRDTVVMIMGDHGESLGEHGESGHGFFVYEAATRVPFIIRAPFDSIEAGHRVETPVRAVDLLPTALDLLGIENQLPMMGVSLVSLLTGETKEMQLQAYSEAVYPRYHFGWSDLAALRVGDLKFIAAPRPELYDLAADPGEAHNLYEERSDLADRMHSRLLALESEWQNLAPAKRIDETDPDTRARLEALGYLGGFVPVDDLPVERASLPDPKDNIHLYNLMRRSREASLGEGGPEVAIGLLQQVLAEDPSIIDAWVRLGNEQRRVQQIDEAIASYQRALHLRPESDLAVINLAHAYRSIDAEDEAILGFQRFLELDPRNEQVRYELAQMLIDRNELDTADLHLQKALEFSPEMAAAQNARGVIALRRSDSQQAEALINAALSSKPDVRLAHFNLALIAEGRGDAREAESLYRRELALYPESYKVEFNLGRLLGNLGDLPGQTTAYERAIEINPQFAEGHFFLAKSYLESNQDLDKAEELARTGLSLDPTPGMVPMGHYLLADIYARQGRTRESEQELAAARASEASG